MFERAAPGYLTSFHIGRGARTSPSVVTLRARNLAKGIGRVVDSQC